MVELLDAEAETIDDEDLETPWLKLQPDLHYVVNPGAGIPTAQNALPLKDALIFGIRLKLFFVTRYQQ
jgi:hypothetical protein